MKFRVLWLRQSLSRTVKRERFMAFANLKLAQENAEMKNALAIIAGGCAHDLQDAELIANDALTKNVNHPPPRPDTQPH